MGCCVKKKSVEDLILIAISVLFFVFCFIVAYALSGCASQNRQVKAHYKYTRICEFTVVGAEVQAGDKTGTDEDITGDDCIIGSKSSSEKTPIKAHSESGSTEQPRQ